ncbi:hypothetical protein [Paenibacillus sp. MBLB4367]|uniref:hypothetical protein n=1 Tax=Paenibacillus sp. MBLB4367 TaxID=3384767 RepID=UPI0039080976
MNRTAIVLLAAAALLSACGKKEDHSVHGGVQSAAPAGHGDHGSGSSDAGSSSAALSSSDVKALWKTGSEKTPKAKQDVRLSVEIQDTAGKPLQNFDINHEKKLHLIAVSKDLSYFSHLHPEYKGNGQFDVTTQFPAGGEYKLFADFIPTGGSAMTKSEWIKVDGDAAKQIPVQPDSQLTKSVDGKEVTLATGKLQASKEATLTFTVKDDKTKAPINNLEQYLGAVGHVVILTEDAEQYLHVHPMEEKATGPDAKFMTTFPKSGVYKIWAQFQHNGKVFTVPYVVKVP